MPDMEQKPLPHLRGFSAQDAPDEGIIDRCVRCGLCLPHCPTYRETLHETSSPRGRIHLMQSVARGKLDLLSPGFVAQMHQCLDCRACEAVCPSGVQYGQLVETARAQIVHAEAAQGNGRQSLSATLIAGIFGTASRFRAIVASMRAYQQSGAQRLTRRSGVLRLLGLAEAEALLPPIPAQFFIPRGQHYDAADDVPTKPTVAFFTGCVMGTVFAPTDRATIRVLNRLGWPVVVPAGQECCGALAVHAGQRDAARDLARRNIAAFEASGAALIVNNAAGCGSALHEYRELLRDDPDWAERAQRFSVRVHDISVVLATGLGASERRLFAPLPLRVTYQEPCHLAHAQRVTVEPRSLLRAIPQLDLIEMADAALCCGSAGIYNLTQPTMAKHLGERKITNIAATHADLVVTANPGCFLQVRAGLLQGKCPTKVIHIVDLLDASLRGTPASILLEHSRQ